VFASPTMAPGAPARFRARAALTPADRRHIGRVCRLADPFANPPSSGAVDVPHRAMQRGAKSVG
jgi:hypothetical protein